MKMTFRKIAAATVLFAMISLPVVAQPPNRPANANTGQKEEHEKEQHPSIRDAIQALERAKADLEHASHDFGGHRAEALKSVNEAIRQLRLALQYDKK